MPSAPVLDLAKLTAPIPGDKPTGVDLRTDSTPGSPYYAVKDARNAARAAERQMIVEGGDAPPADWKPVLQHATKALAEKTKDLEITAYLIEALTRLHGFAGMRDGFQLARELVEKYWDGLYPLPDEEGIDTRTAPLTGLNGDDAEGTLIVPINRVPITDQTSHGRLALSHFQEAQSVNKIADAKAKEKRLAAGAMTLDKFHAAISETQPKFFGELVADINAAQEAYAKLNAVLDQRCNGRAPPSSNVRTALNGVLDTIKDIARAKLDLVVPPKTDEPAKDGVAQKDGAPAAGAGAPAAKPQGFSVGAEVIVDREDAFRILLKVAEYFRKTEPHTIVSYSIEQVVRWGRMPLPDLFQELIPDEAPRKGLFKQIGMKPPEAPKAEAKK